MMKRNDVLCFLTDFLDDVKDIPVLNSMNVNVRVYIDQSEKCEEWRIEELTKALRTFLGNCKTYEKEYDYTRNVLRISKFDVENLTFTMEIRCSQTDSMILLLSCQHQ